MVAQRNSHGTSFARALRRRAKNARSARNKSTRRWSTLWMSSPAPSIAKSRARTSANASCRVCAAWIPSLTFGMPASTGGSRRPRILFRKSKKWSDHMILLRRDCLVFKKPDGESIPAAAQEFAVELIGEALGLLDEEVVKNAAQAVLHYFREELGQTTITVGEFSAAL